MAMSPERRAVLERLAIVKDGMVFVCGGHQRTRCAGLVALGLAEKRGDVDGGLKSAYEITDAGREWLEANPSG
jgi:hypothetical protein